MGLPGGGMAAEWQTACGASGGPSEGLRPRYDPAKYT